MKKLKYTKKELEVVIKSSVTKTEILKKLNMGTGGGHFRQLNMLIKYYNIDTSHLLGQAWLRGKTHYHRNRLSLEEIMVVNSTYGSSELRKRLIKEELLKNICNECGQLPEWNGKPLTLQLDHINGDHSDNRKDNLQILCPNCHTQTETWGTKRFKQTKTPKPIIEWRHLPRPNSRKVERPTKEELEKLLSENGWTTIGRMYGVSDNAVRKWAKSYLIYK